MFIYTEGYTESHRNTQNNNISPRTRQIISFPFYFLFCENPYVSKSDVQQYLRFMVISMVFLILLMATAQLVLPGDPATYVFGDDAAEYFRNYREALFALTMTKGGAYNFKITYCSDSSRPVPRTNKCLLQFVFSYIYIDK